MIDIKTMFPNRNMSPLFQNIVVQDIYLTRLLTDLKSSQNALKYSLFKMCKLHKIVKGRFFPRGQNVPYNG